MPWARFGDDSATYPAMMQVVGVRGSDERTLNEAFGFLARVATQSAGHKTDYLVDEGTARMIGGTRTDVLLKLLVKVGVLSIVRRDGMRFWRIIADPKFIHIRTRAELDRESQRTAETNDDYIGVAIRLRDGDNCRWCGILVEWLGRKSHRSAEPDHLEGLEVPGTPENMVVSCRRCNRGRGANTELWDSRNTLRPTPEIPLYGDTTAKYLTKHGYPTTPNVPSDEAPPWTTDPAPTRVRPQPQHGPTALAAGADPAPDGVRPATPRRTPHPRECDPSKLPGNSAGMTVPQSEESTSPGSGRDGTGNALPPPGGGAPTGTPPDRPRRRRGRRGGSRTTNREDR